MTKAQIVAALQTIVRLQLDYCKRAIKDGTKTIALNELEDAIRQLKLLAKRIEALASVTAREPFHCLLHGCVRPALNITGGQSALRTCVASGSDLIYRSWGSPRPLCGIQVLL